MRLIDADAFEKFIEEKYKDGESTDDIKDQMLFDLSYQPTAYSVENVVAELIELYDEGTCPARDEGEWDCNRSKSCGECFKERMTEIVRNGRKE